MNILEEIIAYKRKEVAQQEYDTPVWLLEQKPGYAREPISLRSRLATTGSPGIIAEFKRRSPSKGIINDAVELNAVVAAYQEFGASAVSVLTDEHFFGGSLYDLEAARDLALPLLRKDFIINEYQLIQSKAWGADIILLIAACLSVEEVKYLAQAAKKLGLEVLLEIHTADELGHINNAVDFVGINNRNLKDFKVDLEHSISLAQKIPEGFIKIAESGINEVATIHALRKHGFRGFLMGEVFMKEKDPGKAFQNFMSSLLA